MTEEELIVAVTAIIFGTGFATFVFARITKLIRIWIETRAVKYQPQQSNHDLLQFKQEVERRLSSLETIVSEETPLLDKQSNLSPEEEIRQLSNLLKNKS